MYLNLSFLYSDLKCSTSYLFKPISLQEGNAVTALKPDFYIFLLIFQHK